MVMAWQTDESMPNPSGYTVEFGTTLSYGAAVTPSGRVVDDYLSAELTLPVPPTASGQHSNYAAVLKNLAYNATYFYRVECPREDSRHFSTPGSEAINSPSWYKAMRDFFRPYPAPIPRGLRTTRRASRI